MLKILLSKNNDRRVFPKLGSLIVLMLLLAIAAPVANAAPKFTASAPNLTMTGTQTGTVMEFGSAVLKCEATYSGKTTAVESPSLTLIPAFKNCSLQGFAATVTGFGSGKCDLELNADGHLDLVCVGQEIIVQTAFCKIRIPSNYNLGVVTYTNIAPHLSIHMDAGRFRYHVSSASMCGITSGGTQFREDGYYVGAMTLKAGEANLQWDAS